MATFDMPFDSTDNMRESETVRLSVYGFLEFLACLWRYSRM